MKRAKLLIAFVLVSLFFVGCSDSSPTEDDAAASLKGILSKDDAEVLIYERLNENEREKYTIDYVKTDNSKYYIRTYEMVDGEIKEKHQFTVDINTEKVEEIE